MAKYTGWTGKILRVDLTTGKISSEDTSKYKDFIGGAGFGYKVLWDEVKPGTKAWDPENRIVFGVGPLSGSGAPTSGRVSITSLYPVAMHELPSTSHMGGHWGPELKHAGWDSIIVQGKAAKPVWLYIFDDKVEIRDASSLWGNGIFRANAEINAIMGPEAHVAAIGQAGENMVRVSNIMCDRSHSGGGLGSVMGSKNLKAIGVRGTGAVTFAADKVAWKALVTEFMTLVGANNQGVVPSTPQPWAEFSGSTRWTARKGLYWGAANPPVETGNCAASDMNKIGLRTHKGVLDHGAGPGEAHTVRISGCFSCPTRCHVATSVPALEKYGVSRFQMNTCVGNSYGRGFLPGIASGTEAAIEASQLGIAIADDYGLWNDYGQITNDFNWLYKNGVFKKYLDAKEFDAIPWKLYEANDPAFLVDIMKRITFKTGVLGKTLADGPAYMEKAWPELAEAHQHEYSLSHWKWGHAKHHSTEAGGQVGGLINMIYNREPNCHTHSNFQASGLPLDVQKGVATAIFGNSDMVDKSGEWKPMTQGKAMFVALSLIYEELHNSLTMCNWQMPLWASPVKERKYVGDREMEAKFFSAVTGEKTTSKDLEKAGLRILTLLRASTALFMNEKDLRNKHDLAPAWAFEYPKDKKPFEAGSNKMDPADWELGKDMLYKEFGWDKATGVPTRATLKELGLSEVADTLEKAGLLPA